MTASASYGIAESLGCRPGTEDAITLVVEWICIDKDGKDEKPEHKATAIFTASWTAPEGAGVHSEQGEVGEEREASVGLLTSPPSRRSRLPLRRLAWRSTR